MSRDTFVKEYTPLSDEQKALIKDIKEQCEVLENLMLRVKGRKMAIALTNLEQSCMWAVKAVANPESN